MKSAYVKKSSGSAYRSHYEMMRIPLIRRDKPVTLGKKTYLCSGCAGHVVFDRRDER